MSAIKLSIAEPCHENWNAMLPEEKGRFCLSCQKTVVDFTHMSDRQVFDYFKNYQGNTCGQFNNDQLDRELTKPKTHSIGRWKYFWQILLPTFFTFQKLQAQPKVQGKVATATVCKPETKKPVTIRMGMVASPQQVQKTNYQIRGKLLNAQKEPIPFATVTSSDGQYTVADSSGRFTIDLNEKASLTISQIGYMERTFTMDSLQTNNISGLKLENGLVVIETTIELKHKNIISNEAIVVGVRSTVCMSSVRLGGIGVRKTTILNKQISVVSDATLPQLKIFPNPVQPGENFQITFQVKKTGSYVLQLTDASGRIVVNEKIVMSSKNQTETINGDALQQAGIYILTFIHPADRKSKPLNGRVVVQ